MGFFRDLLQGRRERKARVYRATAYYTWFTAEQLQKNTGLWSGFLSSALRELEDGGMIESARDYDDGWEGKRWVYRRVR